MTDGAEEVHGVQAPWVGVVRTRRWHGVVAARRPRVAPQQAAQSHPAPAHRAVLGHRLEGVGRAGGVVAADLAVQRADQRTGTAAAGRSGRSARQLTVPCLSPRLRCRQRSSSAPSSGVRRVRGRRQGAHDHLAAGREVGEALTAQVAQPALDMMADRRRCRRERPTTNPTRRGPTGRDAATWTTSRSPPLRRPRADHPPDVTTVGQPMRRGEHGRGSRPGSSRAGSDRQALAALAAARGQDGAPGAGAHAQPEAVHLVAPAVVRLVRTLAHEVSPMVVRGGHAGGGQIARWRQTALVESWSMRTEASAGTAHPRAGGTAPGTNPGGAWTCGTRRHRVTDERYAWRLRGVKSTSAPTARPAPVETGRPESSMPPVSRASRSLWIASCSGPSAGVMFDPRRVSPRSGRTRAPRPPHQVAGDEFTWPLTCGDPVSAGQP